MGSRTRAIHDDPDINFALRTVSFKTFQTQVSQLYHVSLADNSSYNASFAYFLLHPWSLTVNHCCTCTFLCVCANLQVLKIGLK